MEPIKINIEVSLSQRTMDFLRMFTPDMPQDVYDGTRPVRPAKTAERPADEPAPEVAQEPVREENAAPAAPEAPAQADKPVIPTTEDVREAMYAVRRRIEGEDWQENKTSEGYKAFHKKLTDLFKQLAREASKGAEEKPSALGPDQRGEFIKSCSLIRLSEDGKSITDLPF